VPAAGDRLQLGELSFEVVDMTATVDSAGRRYNAVAIAVAQDDHAEREAGARDLQPPPARGARSDRRGRPGQPLQPAQRRSTLAWV
jgi:hypothetical protein